MSGYPTSIRLPEDLRRDLRKLARSQQRDLTNLIVHLLEHSPILADYRKMLSKNKDAGK